MAERKIVEARESFSVHVDGRPVIVVAGQLWWSDDRAVKGREHLFGELSVHSSGPVEHRGTPKAAKPAGDPETAAAAPGTRRTVTAKKGQVDA
ncbi:MAG: hypothetical protein AB7G23_20310 [Vicinamibacterales bacterium]